MDNTKIIEDFYAFDTETTGISIDADEVIQVAAVKYMSGIPVDSFCKKIKPRVKINEESYLIHGIGNNDVQHEKQIEDVSAELDNFLLEKMPIVTYNGSAFDLPMWGNNCNRYGIKRTRVLMYDHIDVFKFVRWAFSEVRFKSLVVMAKKLAVEVDAAKAHDALYDCLLTGEVARRLCFEGHMPSEIGEILSQQRIISDWIRRNEELYSGLLHENPKTREVVVSVGIHAGKKPQDLTIGELRSLLAIKYRSGQASEHLVSFLKKIADEKVKK